MIWGIADSFLGGFLKLSVFSVFLPVGPLLDYYWTPIGPLLEASWLHFGTLGDHCRDSKALREALGAARRTCGHVSVRFWSLMSLGCVTFRIKNPILCDIVL